VKFIIRLALILVAVWLQVSFFGAARIFGIMPDVLLVVIIYAGLICSASEAVWMALVGGLLLDLDSGVDFGLRMGFFVMLSLLIVALKQAGADFANTGMVLAATLGATVLYNLSVLTGVMLGGISVPWGTVLGRVGLEIVINGILALALRWPLGRLLGQTDFTFQGGRRARSIR
jgi:rod shape-determining protein MreD